MEFLSIEHLVVLGMTLALCVVVPLIARRRAPDDRGVLVFARAGAALLVANEIAIRIVTLEARGWQWSTDLPLHLTDAAMAAAAIALWSARTPRLAYELTYFWAFSATVQALLTPDLRQGPDEILFYTFFIAHSGTLVAACYLTWGKRLTLGPRALPRVLAVSVGWTTLAAVGSFTTGGNYMFLREPPPGGSLLDLFGPWPWYIVGAAVLAVVVFSVLARLRRCDPVAWWRGYGELSTDGRPGTVLAWALYDFGNTMFSFAVVSFAMSLWSIRALGEGPGLFWFTVAASSSILLNALLSPTLGAISDRAGRRTPFLAAFTILCVASTALIGFVDIAVGLVLFGIANFSFQAALIYYDAMLSRIARPEGRGRLSGFGTAVGYSGVLVAGAVLQFTLDADGRTTAASFTVIAVLFGGFSIPALWILREGAVGASVAVTSEAARPWRRLAQAFRGAKQTPGLLRFLIARFFYADPINTAIAVMSAFAVAAVGFSEGQALNMLLALVIVAVSASFLWGRLADAIGAVSTLLIVLVVWAVGLSLLAGFLAPVPFVVAAAILGAGLGGTAVLERVVLIRLAPPPRLAEMFGLFGLVGKATAVTGPITYGAIVAALLEPLGRGAYQVAILVLMAQLVVGLVIAARLPRGERAA